MIVRMWVVNGRWAVADRGGWVPGSYASQEDAMRAAWRTRWFGTPSETVARLAGVEGWR